MALFKIEKGLAINLEANRPYAKEGYAYFTTDDGKLYIDISGDGTTPVRIGKDRICLNAANADTADYAIKAKYNEAGYMPNSVSYTNESSDGVKIGTLNIDGGAFEVLYPAPLRISYVASEGQTEFDIPFDFPSINSLTAYHNGVLLEMNKHYTISKADKKLTLNGYSCLSGDDFTIMGINGSANISTGIQYLDDTRILFTDRKNLMLDNSGITMGSNYVPNDDYDVVIKSYVDNLYDQGPMKLYKPQPITIGNTTKEFDGSDGLAWSLEEIGAAAAVHSHEYLPLAGGILTGDLSVPNNIINAKKLVSEYLEGTAEYANRLQNAHTFTIGNTGKDFDGTADVSWTLAELGIDGSYLKLTGGTLTGSLTLNDDPTEALQASTKQYVDNNLKKYLPLTGGEITGELSASKFLGDLTGTADAAKEANKLATACSLTIGNSSKDFDGLSGISWTLKEIGVEDNYLKLSGGTMTGQIKKAVIGSSQIKGRDSAIIVNTKNSSSSSYYPTVSSKTVLGSWDTGALGENYYFSYATDANYTTGNNDTSAYYITPAGLFSGTAQNANYATRAGTANSATTATTLSGKFYAGRQVTHDNLHSTETSQPPYNCLALKNCGLGLYNDSEFASGNNSVEVYNNSSNGNVTITRVADATAANSSGYVLKIATTGTASPGLGGFFQSLSSRANAVFFQLFRAKIPVGYSVTTASNSMGTSYEDQFITDRAGTGRWEWYGRIVCCGSSGSFSSGGHVYITNNTSTAPSTSNPLNWYLSYCNAFDLTKGAYISATAVYGAVWNDYAEYRKATVKEPGRCIIEKGNDTLTQSTKRLQPGASIISDTFGFAIGETNDCKTPIAVSGRVLAYPYESREEFKKNIGHPVCSGPNGTVSIMTDEEYKEKGYLAIGTISAVPDYEEWGTGNVKVDGRVWIKIL